jgi:hypothetical protein
VRLFPPIRPAVSTLVACISCVACASTSTNDPGPQITTRQLSSPGARVIETTDFNGADEVRVKGSQFDAMTALTQIYGELGIPIATMVPDAGQIGNQRLRIPNHRLHNHLLSTYLNCGQESMAGLRADMDEVTISILSTVRVGRDSVTTVGTMVQGSSRPTGTSSSGVTCESTGALEKAIATRLGTVLGVPASAVRQD